MGRVLVLGAVLLVLGCGCAVGGEGKSLWRSSYFDGKEFREGSTPDSMRVLQREGYLPVVTAGEVPVSEDPLPKGMGGILIYSYIQSSGGKMQPHGGSLPLPGTAVELRGEGGMLLLRTDDEGYAVAGLPAGTYEVVVRGISRTLTVEKGATTLLPIRAGKRMVD